MGNSTYVRVNNFQSSRPDEVHFAQRMISPQFCSGVVELYAAICIRSAAEQRPDAPRLLANPNPNGGQSTSTRRCPLPAF